MVELNASERRALTLATALVVLGAAARLGLGPGPAAWAWSPAAAGEAEGSAAEVREAVGRELERARRASRPLADGERIDPNTADAVELDRLPGVGPATAGALVASREETGGYRWREDLLRVRGIGPATLARMAPHLSLDAAPPGLARSAGRPGGAGDRVGVDGRGKPPRVGGAARRIDVNRATAAELEALPGVGPAIARRIVDHRQREGRFAGPEDLLAVPGIGPARLEELRDRVAFGRR